MEDQLKQLNLQLLQKEETINVMKVRTREFVQNLKDEHAVTLRNMQAALSAASEVMHCPQHKFLSLLVHNLPAALVCLRRKVRSVRHSLV